MIQGREIKQKQKGERMGRELKKSGGMGGGERGHLAAKKGGWEIMKKEDIRRPRGGGKGRKTLESNTGKGRDLLFLQKEGIAAEEVTTGRGKGK